MLIRIKNLRLRTIVGINDWERNNFQDIILNIEIELDGTRVIETDDIKDTVDYKLLKRSILQEVEESRFYLLDKLAGHILRLIMENEKVHYAKVEVDKPHALRFADSVSVTCSSRRVP
jgi:D-erythro-7,8-dihydroneopterin triphosphate epimerase